MQFFGFPGRKCFDYSGLGPASGGRVANPKTGALPVRWVAAGLMEVYGGHGGGNRGVGIGAGSIILKEAIRRSQHSEHTVVNRL